MAILFSGKSIELTKPIKLSLPNRNLIFRKLRIDKHAYRTVQCIDRTGLPVYFIIKEFIVNGRGLTTLKVLILSMTAITIGAQLAFTAFLS